jgi:hypothetical protein
LSWTTDIPKLSVGDPYLICTELLLDPDPEFVTGSNYEPDSTTQKLLNALWKTSFATVQYSRYCLLALQLTTVESGTGLVSGSGQN